ncbi:uncharacterized protein AB9W97_006042 [Spinachia spinachia]
MENTNCIVSTKSSESETENEMAEALVNDALDSAVSGINELFQKIAGWKAEKASRPDDVSSPTIEENIKQYLRDYYSERIRLAQAEEGLRQDLPHASSADQVPQRSQETGELEWSQETVELQLSQETTELDDSSSPGELDKTSGGRKDKNVRRTKKSRKRALEKEVSGTPMPAEHDEDDPADFERDAQPSQHTTRQDKTYSPRHTSSDDAQSDDDRVHDFATQDTGFETAETPQRPPSSSQRLVHDIATQVEMNKSEMDPEIKDIIWKLITRYFDGAEKSSVDKNRVLPLEPVPEKRNRTIKSPGCFPSPQLFKDDKEVNQKPPPSTPKLCLVRKEVVLTLPEKHKDAQPSQHATHQENPSSPTHSSSDGAQSDNDLDFQTFRDISAVSQAKKSVRRRKRIFKGITSCCKKAFRLDKQNNVPPVDSQGVLVHGELILSSILCGQSKSEKNLPQRSQETAALDDSSSLGELDKTSGGRKDKNVKRTKKSSKRGSCTSKPAEHDEDDAADLEKDAQPSQHTTHRDKTYSPRHSSSDAAESDDDRVHDFATRNMGSKTAETPQRPPSSTERLFPLDEDLVHDFATEVKVDTSELDPEMKDILRKLATVKVDEYFEEADKSSVDERVLPLSPVPERTLRNLKSPGCISSTQVFEDDKEPDKKRPPSTPRLCWAEEEVVLTLPEEQKDEHPSQRATHRENTSSPRPSSSDDAQSDNDLDLLQTFRDISAQPQTKRSGRRRRRIFKAMTSCCKKAFPLNKNNKVHPVDSQSVLVHGELILSPILRGQSKSEKNVPQRSQETAELDDSPCFSSTETYILADKKVGFTLHATPLQAKKVRERPPSSTETYILADKKVGFTLHEKPPQAKKVRKRPPSSTETYILEEKKVGFTLHEKPPQAKKVRKRPPSSTETYILEEKKNGATRPETSPQLKKVKKPSILKRLWRFLTCSSKTAELDDALFHGDFLKTKKKKVSAASKPAEHNEEESVDLEKDAQPSHHTTQPENSSRRLLSSNTLSESPETEVHSARDTETDEGPPDTFHSKKAQWILILCVSNYTLLLFYICIYAYK